MNNRVFTENPNVSPLFTRCKQFESHEAWDWYIRGCPDDEVEVKIGIMSRIENLSKNEWHDR